jgi:hypothetical protein
MINLLIAATIAAHQIPDPALTPGAARVVSVQELCTTSTKLVRHTSQALKLKIYKKYGLEPRTSAECSGPSGSCYEVDHLIPLEDGGADVEQNLWPQVYDGPWNAHMKDRLENYAHQQICAGKLTIEEAQGLLKGDWTQSYKKVFGDK